MNVFKYFSVFFNRESSKTTKNVQAIPSVKDVCQRLKWEHFFATLVKPISLNITPSFWLLVGDFNERIGAGEDSQENLRA